jgi:serine/threonine-protein kinase
MALRDDLTDRVKARVGTTLNGKWRLDAVLGIGGMAAVYAATHRNQKRVAIKMLHPEVSMDKQVTMRFTREGYVANTVGHPGTVSVLDDDVTDDGAAFLVMERLEGETLDGRWERHRMSLPPGEVLDIADQLLDVLAAAHARGILHRDLKPENLFLTREGRLKVLDFGIARLRELATGESASSTRTGSLLGTPAFMAPEQARGRSQDVDERSDLWAVGATMYTLLSGKYVHETETVNEQLIQTATQPAKSIAKLMPSLPDPVIELVDRALAFERPQRWQSARDFQRAVREARSLVPGGPPLVRSHASMAKISEPTMVAPPEVVSAMSGRGTLTTGRPFMSEIRAPKRTTWPRRVATWGAPILALVSGAAAYAWWSHSWSAHARGDVSVAAPGPSSETTAPPRAHEPPRPAIEEPAAPTVAEGKPAPEAKPVAEAKPAPEAKPVAEAKPAPEAKPPHGKPPKGPAGHTAQAASAEPVHAVTPPAPASTRLDMYERRY